MILVAPASTEVACPLRPSSLPLLLLLHHYHGYLAVPPVLSTHGVVVGHRFGRLRVGGPVAQVDEEEVPCGSKECTRVLDRWQRMRHAEYASLEVQGHAAPQQTGLEGVHLACLPLEYI